MQRRFWDCPDRSHRRGFGRRSQAAVTRDQPERNPAGEARLTRVQTASAVRKTSTGERGPVERAGRSSPKAVNAALTAIRTLKRIEQDARPATETERRTLARFPGFGPLALVLFPDPVTGRYTSPGWQKLGEDLRALLTPEEYASAQRTTFTAFYTAPLVMRAMVDALARLGVPSDATILEPGCGTGNFLGQAPPDMRGIGVELDSLSGRIARARFPAHDIRIENFRDTRLPANQIDAVIGNVPFADVKLAYGGRRLALHDFFFAKSLDALKPGGVLALVTSHHTLDKHNAGTREYLAARADFLGAIRLPSDAFRQAGTQVVTDMVFLKKRAPGEPARHADPEWIATDPLFIDGTAVPINRYLLRHPEMVLGGWSRDDRLYAGTYSLKSTGDLSKQLPEAIRRLPAGVFSGTAHDVRPNLSPASPPTSSLVPQAEGSLCVGADRTIRHWRHGQALPVTHGATPLTADGTLLGRRLAALIGLRDLARRVLHAQNEGWPEAARQDTRRALNHAYDRFVQTYGPINTTTFGKTATGQVVRRMPNLVKFRDDPDAMLVMALEDYDEGSGTATKAAIMERDVVGRRLPVTAVRSAEEGVLVALNTRGRVDLPFIARLYHAPEAQIIAELGDLLYQDPDTTEWQTADVYLSGNVRAKLAAAERAGAAYARNAEALRAVQPEDVLPGDIDATLGAPWIPETDIRDFAATLFNVAPAAIRIGHVKQEALWSVEADRSATLSVAATTEYGTTRANGVGLFEQALNLKTPVLYDVTTSHGKEERSVNQEATLAAREKHKLIKERFRAWVFADPERTARLVRRYNDTYNNLRLRSFDGAHLDFPGMNPTIALHPHQKDAIWRAMSSGNTLLAHAVGAGKSFEMAAAGMKMKQAGLITKPLFVVPNHMLAQFAREFMQLYPNATLLVAGKADVARDRRKLLTAKIASGQWDGILLTHSSFERIGMSRDYQVRFLREQIAEYERVLCDSARAAGGETPRNIRKALEKQKVRREQRLTELLAEDKKDDGLVFDELGVDHLFIDEAHSFKNLDTPTKMERVAGMQTTGSERAFDLYMKVRYLQEQHPGHGVTFATGTPISNTMVELYTMQRYLDPEGLRERGIDHFDGWAATFGEVVDTMEISPDGKSLRPRSRFAKFTNLPELQQMFRGFADVQTADMLHLPRPGLEGGTPAIVACPMSAEQRVLQAALVARYDRLRSQKVDPRTDNALAITTDGRKLALDARLLSAEAEDFPGSKINALADNIAAIWQRTADTRGAQLVFSDIGVQPTPWGYSVYHDLIHKLVERGIPRAQIAAIGEADTDAKKQVLFEQVRAGTIRVLLGSTQKMGIGTNVQQRLVALHHLDAPWKPAEVEQREGRILRQGNTNAEVSVYRYVTTGSFDAYMWQALETKAKFIAQVMTGGSAVRRAEDIGGQELSYAEVKAIASGNPAVLTLAEADADLHRLAVLRKQHTDEQYLARCKQRALPAEIDRLQRRGEALAQDMATVEAHANDPLWIDGRAYRDKDALDRLAGRLQTLSFAVSANRSVPLGQYQGVAFGLFLSPRGGPEVFVTGASTRSVPLSKEHHGPRAVLHAVERIVRSYAAEYARARQDRTVAQHQLRDYEARLGAAFAYAGYATELTELRDRLKAALTQPAEQDAESAALAEQITRLKAAQVIESGPERQTPRATSTAAEPVTSRLLERITAVPAPQPQTPTPEPVAKPEPGAVRVAPFRTSQPALFAVPPPRAGKAKPSHRQRVARDEQAKAAGQLSLF